MNRLSVFLLFISNKIFMLNILKDVYIQSRPTLVDTIDYTKNLKNLLQPVSSKSADRFINIIKRLTSKL